MLKHVGRHGDKKVVVLFKKVPGEDHMCLLVYSDLLPRQSHDAIMSVLESDVGQQANEFAEALHRNTLPNGENTLNSLHRTGLIKKVQTAQVIMTPTSKSTVRLDELNDILTKMALGDEAVKKMAQVDAGQGMADPRKNRAGKDLGEATILQATVDGVLSDEAIAKDLVAQASRMKSQAQALLAEAAGLEQQATALGVAAEPVKKRAGRPKKVVA